MEAKRQKRTMRTSRPPPPRTPARRGAGGRGGRRDAAAEAAEGRGGSCGAETALAHAQRRAQQRAADPQVPEPTDARRQQLVQRAVARVNARWGRISIKRRRPPAVWGGREFRLGPPVIAALTRAVALTLTSTTEVEQRLHMKWRRRKLPSDAGGS